METSRGYFRLCSSCKKELAFGTTYYKCSVSTCNRPRTGLTFCSVACFEAHVPVVRHRDAWAEQAQAPTKETFEREQAEEARKAAASAQSQPQSRPQPPADPPRERRIVQAGGTGGAGAPVALGEADVPRDILIVASKLKAYIRARSGMNTSDGVLDVLSDVVREVCDAAIARAAADGRKTVMARDF